MVFSVTVAQCTPICQLGRRVCSTFCGWASTTCRKLKQHCDTSSSTHTILRCSSNESMEAVTVSGDVENSKNAKKDVCFKRDEQTPYIRFNNNCLYEVEDIDDGAHMFASDILSSIELPLSAPKIPDNVVIRPLRIDDYKRGYLQLLSQLTFVGEVSEEQFRQRFLSMQSTRPKSYYVVVVEDLSTNMLVGSATLVIEWKFIHEAGCRGRTEDVVVDKRMRGKQLGKLLNIYLVELARRIGVYKISLECKDALIAFYGQVGFKVDEGNNFLVQRFG